MQHVADGAGAVVAASGAPGKGRWITVMANPSHTYAVIARLRFDTSSYGSAGNGPRWRWTKCEARGFAVRHSAGY